MEKDIDRLVRQIEKDKSEGKIRSQAEAARRIGVEPQEITNWKSRGNIPSEKRKLISKYYGWSLDYIENGDSSNNIKIEEPNAEYMPPLPWEVPLIDNVAAGEWTEATDPYAMGEGAEMFPNAYGGGKNTFALRVKGESMLDEFKEGTIIYIDPSQMPENGDYCVAKLDDSNEATFKQYVVEDGQKLLKAINPDWPNKYVQINGNCHIVGKMIGVYKKY